MIKKVHLFVTTILSIAQCDNDMPLAPYHLKLYCRSGQAYIPETRTLTLCPSSSTSCGYFEFETLSSPLNGDEPLGIYECVDSSILMSDNDDNEEEKQLLFSKYCDDRARCRNIMLSSFNMKFVQYLARRERVKLRNLLSTRIKFCCAINDPLLQKIISSGDNVLPTPRPLDPVFCSGMRCHGAAIGCLTYLRHNETEHSDSNDVIVVQPVHITYEDHEVLPPMKNQYLTKHSTYNRCVYRHFNDELYRYCLLVHNQAPGGHCFYGDGYQICCCFLSKGTSTCDPLSSKIEAKTSTESSEVTQINSSTTSSNNHTAVYGAKLRTRCRITYELQLEPSISAYRQRRKKLLCDTNVNSASYFCSSFLSFILIFFYYCFTSEMFQ